jgi:hypothetical protein
MSGTPSLNGSNGRGPGGKFVSGNAGGPGNPFGRRTAELRTLLLHTVSDDDLRAIVGKLVELAKGGDMAAIREILTRTIGRSAETPDPDKMELEATRLECYQLEADQRRKRATPSVIDKVAG